MSLAFVEKRLLWLLLIMAALGGTVLAQEADARFPGQSSKNDEDQPFGIRETRVKMRIDQEKKEYEEMIDRSQQALKLSQEIEKSFQQQPSLSRVDTAKLDELEKLVKKVRSELGGGNSDETDDEDQPENTAPKTIADAAKALSTYTAKLVDELKKSSRFTVSVAAIQSSNSALRVVRFLKIPK